MSIRRSRRRRKGTTGEVELGKDEEKEMEEEIKRRLRRMTRMTSTT